MNVKGFLLNRHPKLSGAFWIYFATIRFALPPFDHSVIPLRLCKFGIKENLKATRNRINYLNDQSYLLMPFMASVNSAIVAKISFLWAISIV